MLIKLPFHLLHQQQCFNQADDHGVSGKDADDAGMAVDVLAEVLIRVILMILRHFSDGNGTESKDVLP